MLDALQILADAAGPDTKVVPGHGDLTSKAAIVAQREIAVAVRNWSRKARRRSRRRQRQRPKFDAKVGNAAASTDRFVTQAFTELKRTNATR